jgi:hypothetical protein
MSKPAIITLSFCVAFLFGAAACGPTLVIQDVDYSQPVESVITPDADNEIHDQRYAIKFSIQSLLEEEGITSVDEVRLIRNSAGYYFLTAYGFNHVYVLGPDESELKLKKRIQISEEGIGQPAFNQRGTHIELIDRSAGRTYNLDHN